MTERPILFSGAMVRAILDGRKAQTRRVCKYRITGPNPPREFFDFYDGEKWVGAMQYGDGNALDLCPYGKPGDRLWVREAWADVNSEEGPALAYRADSEIRTWHDFSETFGPDYGAGPSMDYDSYPGNYCMWWSDLLNGAEGHGWRPSIHMPRWASRITLEVTDVRVERLQEISGEDAKREGLLLPECGCEVCATQAGLCPADSSAYIQEFATLWDSINAKRGYGWESNPWVWAVSFRRLDG